MQPKNHDWQIRPERPEDQARIMQLTGAVFGPGRYAKSAYRLRESVESVAALNFVAVENGILRGSVRFWPIEVGGDDALLLGPLAVESAQRGRGIGISLMQTGIARAKEGAWRVILLVGDEPYYGRVGFTKLPAGRLRFPGPVDPNRLLGLGLAEGSLEKLSGAVCRGRAAGAPLS